VWARLEDADTLVAFHAGLSGTSQYVKVWESGPAQFEAFRHSAFPLVAFTDRTISDTFAALICHGVFCRFPGLRIVSIENGGMWVPELLRHLASAHGKMPFAFERHPVEQFHANVWVSPYFEDDMVMLRELLGIDRLLFGSDYPHAEGLADPMSYVDELEGFDDDEIRKFMRDNADGLIGTG
jgi:predicted TIM-barrel fold metal-dependent hydrolase